MRPQRTYLVCAIPRSGSSLLTEGLKSTGVAGWPEEYFWHGTGEEPPWPPDWRCNSYAEYLERVYDKGTTPNSVFGAKMMWGYFAAFLQRVREIPMYTELPTASLMDAVFPKVRYIFLTRKDRVKQAISWHRALQSNVWIRHANAPCPDELPVSYDFERIDALVNVVIDHEAQWQAYFNTLTITPYSIVYEEFIDNYEQSVRDILDYLSISFPTNFTLPLPPLVRQADGLSSQWETHYHADKQRLSLCAGS